MKPIEIAMSGKEYIPSGDYCSWLAGMIALNNWPPKNTYAGIVWALMRSGI